MSEGNVAAIDCPHCGFPVADVVEARANGALSLRCGSSRCQTPWVVDPEAERIRSMVYGTPDES